MRPLGWLTGPSGWNLFREGLLVALRACISLCTSAQTRKCSKEYSPRLYFLLQFISCFARVWECLQRLPLRTPFRTLRRRLDSWVRIHRLEPEDDGGFDANGRHERMGAPVVSETARRLFQCGFDRHCGGRPWVGNTKFDFFDALRRDLRPGARRAPNKNCEHHHFRGPAN